MLGRLRYRVNSDERGITGLETAIVLIAFVMVASVFAYVVLSAGLFSAQKAKEAVYIGLQETRSSVDLKGNVLAWVVNGNVTEIYLTVTALPGADPVDFTNTTAERTVVISYSDSRQHNPSVEWSVTRLTSLGDDYLLDDNELFQIEIDLVASGIEPLPGAHDRFVLELKPPAGAVLTIERSISSRRDEFVVLH